MWCQPESHHRFTQVTHAFTHRMAWQRSWRQPSIATQMWQSGCYNVKRMWTKRMKWNRWDESNVAFVLLISWHTLREIILKNRAYPNSRVTSFTRRGARQRLSWLLLNMDIVRWSNFYLNTGLILTPSTWSLLGRMLWRCRRSSLFVVRTGRVVPTQ